MLVIMVQSLKIVIVVFSSVDFKQRLCVFYDSVSLDIVRTLSVYSRHVKKGKATLFLAVASSQSEMFKRSD
jgi:hypothetical protein